MNSFRTTGSSFERLCTKKFSIYQQNIFQGTLGQQWGKYLLLFVFNHKISEYLWYALIKLSITSIFSLFSTQLIPHWKSMHSSNSWHISINKKICHDASFQKFFLAHQAPASISRYSVGSFCQSSTLIFRKYSLWHTSSTKRRTYNSQTSFLQLLFRWNNERWSRIFSTLVSPLC